MNAHAFAGGIKTDLDNEKFDDSMGRVRDVSSWLHANDHQEIIQRLKQLNKQWNAMIE